MIDIAVAVSSVDVDGVALIDAVQPLGYVFFDAGMTGRLMCTRNENGARAQHLHILPVARWDLLNERLFRDWLLAHPVDRDRYGALKIDLGKRLGGEDYTRAKTEFIQGVVDAARAERGLPSLPVWED